MAERGLRAVDLMRTGAAQPRERRLAEPEHARSAYRIRAEYAARRVDRQVRAHLLLASVDRLPPFADVAEAEVLEPHRLEPGERDVDLGGVDLLPRILDAGAVVDGLRAHLPGPRTHLVATRSPHRLGIRGARSDPGRLVRRPARHVFRADHERARAVGRRARLAVADRIPQHRRVHHVVERHRLAEIRVLVPSAVLACVDRGHRPDVRRAFGPGDVRAHVRREVAARTRDQWLREGQVRRQGPHRVALGLLLEGDGEDPLEEPGAHVRYGGERGRRADRAGGVYPDERLQVRTEGAGEELFRLHDALEHVRRFPDHDGVDVPVLEPRVEERAVDGLAHEPGDADVGTPRGVLRLSDAQDRRLPAHVHLRSSPSTQTTFCWRQWPWAPCAMARRAPATPWPSARPASCRNASPSRMSPAIITGLPTSGPPDGLIAGREPAASSPIASQRISSSAGVVAQSSTTSTSAARASPAIASARSVASFAPALRERSRPPSVWSSMRWSTPRIHAGRSHIFSAFPSAARIRQTALSPTGGR